MDITQQMDFNPVIMVSDDRIVPEGSLVRDPFNSHIIRHEADLAPDKRDNTRETMRYEMQLRHPSYLENDARNMIVSSLQGAIKPDETLSPVAMPPQRLPSDPWQMPFQHFKHGEPFADPQSPQGLQILRDAVATMMLLEHYSVVNNLPDTIPDIYTVFDKAGISNPDAVTTVQALQPLTGMHPQQLMATLYEQGPRGVGTALGMDAGYVDDVLALADYMAQNQFALNDVVNWTIGRSQHGMAHATIEDKIATGLEVRPDITMAQMDKQAVAERNYPLEMSIANMMSHVPPVLANLFFETNGRVVYSDNPDLREVIEQQAQQSSTGLYDYLNVRDVNRIYITNPTDSTEVQQILVHELNHEMFPAKFSMDNAIYGDRLLHLDTLRIGKLVNEVTIYNNAQNAGDVATAQGVIDRLSANTTPDGMTFAAALGGELTHETMAHFTKILDNATQWLTMHSRGYDGHEGYNNPIIRFKELIPRYCEARYVQDPQDGALGALNKDMLAFIVPGMTELYRDIYLPHIASTLQDVYNERGSKAQAMMYTDPMQDMTVPLVQDNMQQAPDNTVAVDESVQHGALQATAGRML